MVKVATVIQPRRKINFQASAVSENTNGLIRRFFPKGTDFNEVSEREILKVQDLMNSRPRKTLDFQTPKQVFAKESSTTTKTTSRENSKTTLLNQNKEHNLNSRELRYAYAVDLQLKL